MTRNLNVAGFPLQESPPILVAAIPGLWLLEHSTPSWRIEDPILGFQRVVREKRARQIAAAVLDQQRSFPNAIVLATDLESFTLRNGHVDIPRDAKFLVVDGQHRLWAQQYSKYEADYACLIHPGLAEKEMAELFLEINDNQKRVPSSLRWDLVRLVRPEDDPWSTRAADLTWDLNEAEDSPLRQRIDLTGESSELSLQQGSLAPSIKSAISSATLRDAGYAVWYEILCSYFVAIRSLDPDGWGLRNRPVYQARVLRAFLRLLPTLVAEIGLEHSKVPQPFAGYLDRVDMELLSLEKIRAAQGSAGIKAIHDEIHHQIFG